MPRTAVQYSRTTALAESPSGGLGVDGSTVRVTIAAEGLSAWLPSAALRRRLRMACSTFLKPRTLRRIWTLV
jgi:hypothetical protein